MTFDHVGRCDDVIWRYSRRLQDQYYPFMDALHSHRCLRRDGYEDSTLQAGGARSAGCSGLPGAQRLLLARALERQAVVYTLDPGLLARPELPVRAAAAQRRGRSSFPGGSRRCTARSLELRIEDSAAEEIPMYGGVMVPLVTPLCGDGSVCPASVERLVASVRPAATGLIPALSSGEGWQLDVAQWRDMVTLTRRFAGGLPVLAGIELPTTRRDHRARPAGPAAGGGGGGGAAAVRRRVGRRPAPARRTVLAHLRAIAEAARCRCSSTTSPS